MDKKIIQKGCLYILLGFLTFLGGCSILLFYGLQKGFESCSKPQDLSNTNSRVIVPEKYQIYDVYDYGRGCSFQNDGVTNGVLQLKAENLSIQELEKVTNRKWSRGPINKKVKGFPLYRFAFGGWDENFKNFGRPKLPTNILFLNRQKLFDSKSLLHWGSCENATEEEFIPCGDGVLMIYDPLSKIIYYSNFNS